MNDFTLTETLHETLSLAVTDARKLDHRLYEPRYFYWHSPDNGLCLICLAGCIVAGSLATERDREILPCSFCYQTHRKLQAVNACRVGDWSYAFHTFHRYHPSIESQARLESLDAPDRIDFNGWEAFDAHVRSIESIIPLLAKIELDALKP